MKKNVLKKSGTKFPAYEPWISNEDKKIVHETLKQTMLTLGPKLEKFENDFCKYSKAKYAVAVSNCTAALHISLMALGIGKDDEVIISPLTLNIPVNAIASCGAKPIFTDVREDFNLDPYSIESKITSKTS